VENAEKGLFNLVFGEPAGKVLGLTNVELATRLADKDLDNEYKTVNIRRKKLAPRAGFEPTT
jgi:hypothetical protein